VRPDRSQYNTIIQKYVVVLLHVSALFGHLQGGTRQKNTTTTSFVIDVKQYSQNTKCMMLTEGQTLRHIPGHEDDFLLNTFVCNPITKGVLRCAVFYHFKFATAHLWYC